MTEAEPGPDRPSPMVGGYLQIAAVAYFVALVVVAHFLVHPDYSWLQHTIDDMAGQKAFRPRTMRLGFVGFGAMLALGFLYKVDARGHTPLEDWPLIVYSGCMVGSGMFAAAPFNDYPFYSIPEAIIHSVFAALAGVALSLGMLLYGLRPANDRRWRIVHFGALLLTIALSAAFLLAENGVLPAWSGLIQRLLYAIGLGWLAVTQWVDARSASPA